jgi:hypothetical protein
VWTLPARSCDDFPVVVDRAVIHPIGVMRPSEPGVPISTPVHEDKETTMRGTGRAVFIATLLLFVGTLNIFYGIGALGNAHVYVGETRLVFNNLHTYGWVLIILGVIQLTGGFSLFAGNAYGRVIGIIAASLGALSNLTSIGGNDPWWRLGAFALCVYILYGLIVFGQDVKEAKQAGQM